MLMGCGWGQLIAFARRGDREGAEITLGHQFFQSARQPLGVLLKLLQGFVQLVQALVSPVLGFLGCHPGGWR
jgi:hypothetical protein